jgi:hypothetical protein
MFLTGGVIVADERYEQGLDSSRSEFDEISTSCGVIQALIHLVHGNIPGSPSLSNILTAFGCLAQHARRRDPLGSAASRTPSSCRAGVLFQQPQCLKRRVARSSVVLPESYTNQPYKHLGHTPPPVQNGSQALPLYWVNLVHWGQCLSTPQRLQLVPLR